MKNMGTIK